MALFRLRFPVTQLAAWAKRYSYPDDDRIERIGKRVLLRGYITKREFLDICHWKSARTKPRCESNSERLVKEASAVAFAASNDRFKMAALLALSGVSWPTASVFLHFCDRKAYPILDFRALWSLGFNRPPRYTFDFWVAYCDYSRTLAHRAGLNMRTTDRALWQYSKTHQT